jgi:hypothetical protein
LSGEPNSNFKIQKPPAIIKLLVSL